VSFCSWEGARSVGRKFDTVNSISELFYVAQTISFSSTHLDCKLISEECCTWWSFIRRDRIGCSFDKVVDANYKFALISEDADFDLLRQSLILGIFSNL
jgi:hypothetical protein